MFEIVAALIFERVFDETALRIVNSGDLIIDAKVNVTKAFISG